MSRHEVEDLRSRIWTVLFCDHSPADKFLFRRGWTLYPREIHDAALWPLIEAGWVSLFDVSRSDVEPVADTPEEVWRRIDEILSAPREERDIDLWIGLTVAGRVEAARVLQGEEHQLELLEAGIQRAPVTYATGEGWVGQSEGVEV
jgi:hypothetical protein